MKKFNFISEEEFRKTLESDYSEMEINIINKGWKSVLILSGSIIEAILIDYLLSLENSKYNSKELFKWDLNKAITTCFDEGIISEKAKNLSDVVRNYRNLIHPGRAVRTKEIADENDANIAKSLVEVIVKEISKKKEDTYGYTAEQMLNKVEKDTESIRIWGHLISKLNSYEKTKLLISLLPSRYIALEVEADLSGGDDVVEKVNIIKKFFHAVYNESNKTLKKKVANEFCRVIKEGTQEEVALFIKAFFRAEYLEDVSPDENNMIKKRILPEFQANIGKEYFESFKGIGKYLTESEAQSFIFPLLRIGEVPPKKLHERFWGYDYFANREYQIMTDKAKKSTLAQIDARLSYEDNKDMRSRIEYFADYIQQPDPLPF